MTATKWPYRGTKQYSVASYDSYNVTLVEQLSFYSLDTCENKYKWLNKLNAQINIPAIELFPVKYFSSPYAVVIDIFSIPLCPFI